MLDHLQKCLADVVQMLLKCFVFSGMIYNRRPIELLNHINRIKNLSIELTVIIILTYIKQNNREQILTSNLDNQHHNIHVH